MITGDDERKQEFGDYFSEYQDSFAAPTSGILISLILPVRAVPRSTPRAASQVILAAGRDRRRRATRRGRSWSCCSRLCATANPERGPSAAGGGGERGTVAVNRSVRRGCRQPVT